MRKNLHENFILSLKIALLIAIIGLAKLVHQAPENDTSYISFAGAKHHRDSGKIMNVVLKKQKQEASWIEPLVIH